MMTYKQLSYKYFYDQKRFVPLRELTDVVSGIFMRSGEVFVLEDFAQTADSTLGFSRRIHQKVMIESDIAMPLIRRNTDIAFLNPEKIITNKGIVFIEAKHYSRSTNSPLQRFFLEHPMLSEYIMKCCQTESNGKSKNAHIAFNVLSTKQSDILFSPKHILSIKEGNSQAFFDNAGIYAISTGMYGVKSHCCSVITDKVLSAIFNSRLFSFLRYKEEQSDNGNKHACYDSVARFPLPAYNLDSNLLKALETMTECLTLLNDKELENSDPQVRRCLQQILEMLVLELYFDEYMMDTGLSIEDSLSGSILNESAYDILSRPKEIYKWFQTSSNIIRQKILLLDSRSSELLYPIFMQFTK